MVRCSLKFLRFCELIRISLWVCRQGFDSQRILECLKIRKHVQLWMGGNLRRGRCLAAEPEVTLFGYACKYACNLIEKDALIIDDRL